MSVILSLKLGKSYVLKTNFLEEKKKCKQWTSLDLYTVYHFFLPTTKNAMMYFYEFTN